MFHRIQTATPLDDMQLLVTFQEGHKRLYDVKPLLSKWPAFKLLENPALFKMARVDAGGFGVVWNEELDLACDELWNEGMPV